LIASISAPSADEVRRTWGKNEFPFVVTMQDGSKFYFYVSWKEVTPGVFSVDVLYKFKTNTPGSGYPLNPANDPLPRYDAIHKRYRHYRNSAGEQSCL
jgi:hypothetical protein